LTRNLKQPPSALMIRPIVLFALAFFFSTAPAAWSENAPSTPPEGGRPVVIGESYVVHSTVLNADRRVNVYLPQDYGDPKRTFPVLYLLDGGEDGDFHQISGLAQVNGAYGAVQQMIVVGIEQSDRRHDLTSPSSDPEDVKVAPTSGGAIAFRRFLVEDLKPWVAAHYRTNGHSALIGESLAGLFTLETFLEAPKSFDDYIAVSPSLWWNKYTLSHAADADLRRGGFEGRRLWLATATEGAEMQAADDRVVAALKASAPNGLVWTYDPHPTERHDTIYHPAAMTALRTLYEIKKP
jgi:predicted alpha/beta superfamily hydrolase